MLALQFLIAAINCMAFLICVRCQKFNPVNISLPKPPSMTGVLAYNDVLKKAEGKFDIEGPESFATFEGKVYASGKNGLYQLEKERQVFITSIKKGDCDKMNYNESVCGRPLGLEFDHNGLLYVADAYFGIFTINITTLEIRNLVSKEMLDRKNAKFVNSLQINGNFIYFTSSSSKWNRYQFLAAVLEGRQDGRVFQYNIEKKTLRRLVSKLIFPNGLLLSPEKDFLLIAQTPTAKIIKYYINGTNKGKQVTFAYNMPVLPDNLKYNAAGNVLVASGVTRFAEKPSVIDIFANNIKGRRSIYKALIHNKENLPKTAMVLELNGTTGQIERCMYDINGTVVSALSEAFEINGTMYLGSYVNPSYFTLQQSQI